MNKIFKTKDLKKQQIKNKDKSLKIKYIKELKESVADSTSHGLPRIVKRVANNEWSMALLWTIAFIASFVYCIYTIVNCFMQYYSFEVNLKISKINDLPSVFPVVTICNINPFYWSTVNEYLYKIDNRTACFTDPDTFLDCMESSDTVTAAFKDFIDQLKRAVANDFSLTEDDKGYYGYQFKDMFFSCTFNGESCMNSDDAWDHYWDKEYGFCFSFNRGNETLKPKMTSAKGNKYGLQMEFITNYEFTQYLESKSGIYLRIHNQTDLPFTLNEGINISPGTETYVAVNRQFTNKLSQPYSNCIEDLTDPPNEYAKIIFGYFADLNVTYYNQNFCYTLCYQDKLFENCSCIDIITPSILSATYCADNAQYDCYKKFDKMYTQADINALCKNACPQKCKEIEYILSQSTAVFPSINYLKMLTKIGKYMDSDSKIDTFARHSVSKLIVNYENLYYTSLDENPAMDATSLFGFLGGQLGLFIGVSLLSLMEAVEFIIQMAIIWYKHRRTGNKSSTSTLINSSRNLDDKNNNKPYFIYLNNFK